MIPLYALTDEPLPDYARHPAFEPAAGEPAAGVYLLWDTAGMALAKAGEKGRVRVDFTAGAARHRRVQGGGELLAKAVNHRGRPQVWDATGGLGRDSFVLAGLGLPVCVFERHPAVYCLLADGLARARQHPDTAEIAVRIRLYFADAAAEMPHLAADAGRPEVVYLDPMYPERQKTAAVKKEMAYFHELVGTAQDDAALLDTALAVAGKRVVVKRPRLGDTLCGRRPDYQYSGKSTRFDVYRPLMPCGEEA